MKHRHKGLSFYRRRKKISSTLLREILSWMVGILAALLLAIILVYSFGMRVSVIGVSMENSFSLKNSLYNSQVILVNRIIYKFSSPQKGDVVVFLPGGNQKTHYYVKRVAAVPGDTVFIAEGKLYVNGEVQDEEAYDKIEEAGIAAEGITMGKDEYFVLGDNRNNSEDSRSANIGPVRKEMIAGKAWFHMAAGSNGMGFVK